jgi:hypothetical protein
MLSLGGIGFHTAKEKSFWGCFQFESQKISLTSNSGDYSEWNE